MHENSLSHLSDSALTHGLRASLRHERASTNTVLTHLAEFDARQLYRAAGFPSMYVYCIEELHLAEGAALKRIRAARATSRFPQLFEILEDGRLHLSGLAVLANHLTSENVEELVALCTYKPKKWIEELVAARFPKRDMPERVRLLVSTSSPSTANFLPSPGTVKNVPTSPAESSPSPLARPVNDTDGSEPTTMASLQMAPAPVASAVPHARVTPLSADRYGVQATVAGSTHEKLRRAHELLGLPFGSGHIATVLDRALDALIERLEKRKLAATQKPRAARTYPRAARNVSAPHTIPAGVKRAVRARDGGRCTYVAGPGRRCPERSRLEYEHVIPVARGGESTVGNIRLLCRAHNQLAAEHAFGAEFMAHKRQTARRSAPESGRAASP
jgi:5-methylcytosine-specific restriction endonuclease McrA